MTANNPEIISRPKILVAAILNRNGFQAYKAYSGRSAISLSEQIAPDMMISDVMMPDVNGVEVASEVQSRVPHCRIFLSSGYITDAQALIYEHGNTWELLSKPVDPDDLLAKLKNVKPGEQVPLGNQPTRFINERRIPRNGSRRPGT